MKDRYGICAAPMALAIGLLLAGCGDRAGGPAPLVTGEAEAQRLAAMPPPEPAPRPHPIIAPRPEAAPRATLRITVGPGESLSGIAHRHHVPESVLIAANHLQPPYRVQAGRVLLIPGAGAVAELPRKTETAAAPPSPKGKVLAARTTAPHAADVAADVAAEEHGAAAPGGKPAPAKPAEAAPGPAHAGGAFPWPVRGRLLATYGTGPDGTHNDGINIAAPKGTAIEAIDAGTVAYAGNELRGYGNLVLIKHVSGWISAYAHCDQLLVKRGQKVARGQTIARVGATGSVHEPQLHFELRRGNHPVDPRGFLAPLPTAAVKPATPG